MLPGFLSLHGRSLVIEYNAVLRLTGDSVCLRLARYLSEISESRFEQLCCARLQICENTVNISCHSVWNTITKKTVVDMGLLIMCFLFYVDSSIPSCVTSLLSPEIQWLISFHVYLVSCQVVCVCLCPLLVFPACSRAHLVRYWLFVTALRVPSTSAR